MDNLLHPSTSEGINRILNSSPHAIGLSGKAESGKKHIAKFLVAKMLDIDNAQNYPYIRYVDCSNDVGIEEVRDAIKFLSLKLPGSARYKRALVFWSFELLGRPAQNALLKTLEEPPEDALIIITTGSKNKLLPTIISRLSWINVLPVSYEEAVGRLSGEFSEKLISRSYSLSGGRVGMLLRLVRDYENHPHAESVEHVKNILKMEKPERLAEADRLSKDKEFNTNLFLESLSKVLEAAMKNKLNKTGKIDRKLLTDLKRISKAQNRQQYNANQKLILTEIFYNL